MSATNEPGFSGRDFSGRDFLGDFSVWAPRADRVDLSTTLRTVPMHRGEDAWWRLQPQDLAALRSSADGTEIDYGYLIDGAETALPDPRSRRQPGGVHERSRTFDPGAYRWGDAGWTGRPLAGGVIYELHVGTFTPEGTLAAVIERLDHLAALGVDFIELLPVNGFNGTHNWGYDGVLWYTVHEQYGGPAGYQAFVDACHRRGIGVIQDVVYNHLGPSGNYLPQFGPYLNDASANTWGASVNLDGDGSDEVRRYIIENALMWLGDYHVDGLRLDAVHALADHTATHLLEELAQEVDALAAHVGRPLTLIAESDLNDPRLIRSREAHGYGLTAQWSDDFHHAMHVNLTGEAAGYYEDFASVGALAKVLTRGFFHDGTYSSFRGRRHGRPVDTELMPTSRFVVCTQNHDQIGNRAVGDRLTASLDEHSLGIAAVFTLLGPFTPMLFMGEEWAASTPWQFFTSHPEPELAEATASGRIEEFARMGWDPAVVPDPQDPETFTRSHLDWSERESGEPESGGPESDGPASGRHAAVLALYRRLGELRRAYPDFTDPRFGRIRVQFDEDGRWLQLRRGRTLIAAHFGEGDVLTPGSGPLEQLVTIGDVEIAGEGIRLGTHSCLVAVSAA